MKTKILNVLVALLLVLGCSLVVAVPTAVAQTTPASGTISGTVTSAGSLENVSVYARGINGNPGAGFGITDNSGKYTIAGLPFGTYIVYSPAGGGSADANYVRQYYNDKPDRSTADTVNISAGSPDAIDINFNFNLAGSITGLVTAGGTPVAGVTIVALVNNTFEYVTHTTTRESGTYTLNLPVGSYVVQAKPADAQLPYADKLYNNVYFQNLVTPVPVTLGATTTNINFSLDPAGFITGRVTAGGTPLPDVPVCAKDPTTGALMSWVTTGADGAYTLYLPAGSYRSYLIEVLPSRNQLPYTDKYYNNVYFKNQATPVSVTVGNTTSNINFSLDPAGFITGNVTARGTPLANVWVDAQSVTTGQFVDDSVTRADGTYTLNLPAGSYLIEVFPSRNQFPYTDKYYNNVYFQNQATPVTVTVGDTTNNINFNLTTFGAMTATFSPSSGPVGTSIMVIGIGWVPSDTISGVTVSGIAVANTLKVDATGELWGKITVPSVAAGTSDIVFTSTACGDQTFAKAFTITTTLTPTPTPIPTPTTTTTTASTSVTAPTNWPLIGGIIGAVVVTLIILLVVILIRRRQD